MDWTRTGASPPTSTHPTLIFREIRRGTAIRASILRGPPSASFAEHVEHHVAVLRLVELEQDQPLPLAEQRLSGADRDGMRGRAEQHVADVRLAVRAFVSFLEVLGPPLQVVVGVVDPAGNEGLQAL